MYLFRSAIIALIIALLAGFVQAEQSKQAIRFVVIGDSRGSSPQVINKTVLEKIVQMILELDPPAEFVMITGDLVRAGKNPIQMREGFAQWLEVVDDLYQSDMWGQKVYPAPGNHDVGGFFGPQIWRETFSYLPDNGPANDKKGTYSFDVGPCHITVLNSEGPVISNKVNHQWLINDLAASDKPMKLVFAHKPAYPMDGHIGSSLDLFPARRDEFWQILVDYDVKAYFCGHEHLYDHWIHNGVHQIITAGAGAPLSIEGAFFHFIIVDATESDAHLQVIDIDNQLRDNFTLSDIYEGEDRSDAVDFNIFRSFPCALFIVLPLCAFLYLTLYIIRTNKHAQLNIKDNIAEHSNTGRPSSGR